MAGLEIVKYPDSRLREVCAPVEAVDDRLRQLLNNMAETMYDAPGVGLAGPQVGVMSRIIVVDVGGASENRDTVSRLYKLINPELVSHEGKIDSEEGCLSIPGITETISRYSSVVVEAIDERGKEVSIEAEGFLAIALQHEIDHLDGVLFIDHLSRLKREIVKAKAKKYTKSHS